MSVALRLRHASGTDTFHLSQCVNPHQVRCTAYLLHPSSGSPEPSTQDFYFWQMPEHNAAIQLNSARSRQEVKHRNNKQHPVTFQNKTLRVDTSTQISKKRHTQALLLILQSGTLRVVVFNNTDQWPWSQVIMWLSQELLSLVTPAVYHTMRGGLKSQPVEIAGQRSKTGSEPQRSRPVSSGNWGLCISFDVTNAHAYIALHQLRQWQHIQIQKHVKTHTYGKLEPKNVWHFNFNSNNELLLFLFVWFG